MVNTIYRFKWFVGLVLVQVLILNQMHISGYATPFLYIYFILKINSKVGRNELMLWSFMLGLAVEIFGNTPGMNAAAATCLAFSRSSLLRLATLRSEDEGFVPGIKSLGVSSFSRYTLLASALFCTVLLLIDTFSFFHFGRLILKIIASTISTLIFIFCAESIGGKK
jgi:rod shape-determining protein MreD